MKHILSLIGIVAMMAVQSCDATSQTKTSEPDSLQNSTDSILADSASLQTPPQKHLTLLFAGDIMQHKPQVTSAMQADGTYDYTECFRFIGSEIADADVVVANFETTLAGKPYTGYPTFSSPDELLRDCKKAGIDVFLTANNHMCDKGRKGIERTLMMMDSLGVAHLGSYKDSTERAEHYPLLLEKNGFRLALLNYTYGTNGIPVPAPNVVNIIDTIQIARDINKAQSMKPDAIIAFMHWGVEYTLTPMKNQIDLADWLLKKGVTHVIGGHPHVVEPIEVREDKNGAKHVVAYSLGNLISNQSAPHTYGGMLVKMQLEKDSVTRMKDCNYSLYFVSRPVNSGNKQYRIYPVATPDSLLRPTEIRLRDTFVNSVRPFFEKRNKNIKEVMTFDISSFIE